MSNQKLMPKLTLTNAELFTEVAKEAGEESDYIFNVMYLQGSPRPYRANMSTAVINLNGKENITQPKDDFSFAPFAYRYFEADLFGKNEKHWVEFFFLNSDMQVCSIMFHEYTAQSFKQHYADELFYERLTPCEVVFTVRFEEKTAEVTEGDKKVTKKYFIGSWKSTPISTETKDAFYTLVDCLMPVYREDTIKEHGRLAIESENYRKAISKTALEIKKQEEWRRQDALLDEFKRTSIADPQPSASNEAAATSRVLSAGKRNR